MRRRQKKISLMSKTRSTAWKIYVFTGFFKIFPGMHLHSRGLQGIFKGSFQFQGYSRVFKGSRDSWPPCMHTIRKLSTHTNISNILTHTLVIFQPNKHRRTANQSMMKRKDQEKTEGIILYCEVESAAGEILEWKSTLRRRTSDLGHKLKYKRQENIRDFLLK